MDTFLTLIRREWMQHRFGWMLLVTVPLALALLGLVVGQIEFDSETAEKVGPAFPTLLGMIAMTAGTVVTFTILGATSLLLLTGLARRDHADRSVEFWLSLPTSHTASLAAPLVTHLLLVPAAALVVGLVGGWVISGALVTRLTGFGSWLALPWADLLLAGVALVLRIMAGLPLAVLWAAPLLLAVVLANAYLKRWGLPVLILGLVIAGVVLDRWLGEGATAMTLGAVLRAAGLSLFAGSSQVMNGESSAEVYAALKAVPAALSTQPANSGEASWRSATA
jgi:ABC-2 type transport system permease protein